MDDDQKDQKDDGKGQPSGTIGKSTDQLSTTFKLFDAAFLLFLFTALSLGISVFYVIGLSYGFHCSIQSYFELKDYIEVTAYWVGPVLAIAVLMIFLHAFSTLYLESHIDRALQVLKAFPFFDETLLHAVNKALRWLAQAISFIMIMLVYFAFVKDVELLFNAIFVIFWTWCVWVSLLTIIKVGGNVPIPMVFQKMQSPGTLHYFISSGFAVIVFALLLGSFWTPAVLKRQAASWIYLLNGKTEVIPKPIEAKILFSLTQYVIAFRSDAHLVAIPVGRVQRIESSEQEVEKPTLIPIPIKLPLPLLLPVPSPTPIPTPTPRPSPTPLPPLTLLAPDSR